MIAPSLEWHCKYCLDTSHLLFGGKEQIPFIDYGAGSLQ